jgi:hypothetical protein
LQAFRKEGDEDTTQKKADVKTITEGTKKLVVVVNTKIGNLENRSLEQTASELPTHPEIPYSVRKCA